jgi:shikimate kinase
MLVTVDQHIALVGLMGSGKTTVGRSIAAVLGRVMRDSDEDISAQTGLTAAEYSAAHGIDALHALEAVLLLDALASAEPVVVAAAASTIEDARCRAALGDAFVIWLKAAPPVLATRAQSSRHRPLDTDAVAQLEAQARRRAPLFAAVADQVVDVT